MLVGDGSYVVTALIQHCQRLRRPVKLISRLRLDAQLYDPPPADRPKGKRGPKPKKGQRQPKLADRLTDPQTRWLKMDVT